MTDWLDTEGVARRLGVLPRTITEYLYRSRQARKLAGRRHVVASHNFPEPDDRFGGRPVWKPSTIARYERQKGSK